MDAEYMPYTTQLNLEPYMLPDLNVVVGNRTAPRGPTSVPRTALTAHGHEYADNMSVTSYAADTDADAGTSSVVDADQGASAARAASGTSGSATTTAAGTGTGTTAPPTRPVTLLRGQSIGRAVTGTVSVTVYTPHPVYSMCGWLLKKSDTFLVGGNYRPYYFVLMNGELQYFQQEKMNNSSSSSGSEHQLITLDQPKKMILCENIISVSYRQGVIGIVFKQKGVKGVWMLKADPNSEKDEKMLLATFRMWARKLIRCSPNVPDPALKAASSVGLFPAAGVTTRTVSSKTHTADGKQHELVKTFSKERRPSTMKLGKN